MRDYVHNLPEGLRLSTAHGSESSGMDQIQGKTFGFDIRGALVYRHEDRIYLVQTIVAGTDETGIEEALKRLLSVAGTDFDPNPRLVPPGEYLRCNDGLSTRIVRTQQVLSASRAIPLLVVHVEHPKLKLQAHCTMRPQECVNLPKSYLE
jgi:hypothetical protein